MRYLPAVLAVLTATVLNAQDAPVIVGQVLYEDDPNRTLISKPGWLRGLHFLGDELDPAERPRISALIPTSPTNETLCARITSISGNYEALVQFLIPGTPPGGQRGRVQALTFQSAFPDTVKSITSRDSGVTVQRGDCAEDTQGVSRYFATFWNNTPDALARDATAPASLILNMNISRADEIDAQAVFKQADPASSAVRAQALPTPQCEKIDRVEALAFNYRCAVQVPPVAFESATAAMIEFSYEAVYRGRTSPRRSAEIELGAVR